MKRIFVILSIGSIFVTCAIVSLFYYLFFFRPMRSNQELFPKDAEQIKQMQADWQKLRKEVSVLRKEGYGISFSELEKLNKEQIYFIDGREPEEFAHRHIQGARHIRTFDIDNTELIKKSFNMDDDEFQKSLFVIYCHDGTRTSKALAKLDADNVKFLIDGVRGLDKQNRYPVILTPNPVFRDSIKNHDFSISVEKALNFLERKDVLFIEGRLYKDYIFPFAYDFRIGKLSTQEYGDKLTYILQFKDKDIIYIAEVYPDLFYAKLLIQRLQDNYGFNPKRFHILFRQTDLFYEKVKESGLMQRSQAESLKVRKISSGEHIFVKDITIEKDEVLMIEPGAHLKMGKNSRIIVNGKIVAKGTKEKPIIFEGDKGYWRGIIINGSEDTPESKKFWQWLREGDKEKERIFFSRIQEGNIFDYCEFKNTSTKDRKLVFENRWKATLEAYSTSVWIANSRFEDILHIGGVLTQRAYVIINDNLFISNPMHKNVNCTDNSIAVIYKNTMLQQREKNQTCADGIWMRDSAALIFSNRMKGIGDDGIDTDGSYIVVINNKIDTVWDDGIDIDYRSISLIIQNSVKKSNDNAILISRASEAVLVDNMLSNSKNGLTLRDGAQVVANKLKIQNNGVGVLLFQESPESLQNSLYLTGSSVKNNERDISPQDKYSMQIKDTEFLTEKYYSEVQKLCQGDFDSALIAKLNVSSVYSNAERIIEILEHTYLQEHTIVLEKGCHRFPKGLVVPKEKVLLIKPGAYLVMGRGAKITVKGKIKAQGTEEEPIIFDGDGDYWRGIEIIGNDRAPDIDEYKTFFKADRFENSNFISSLKNNNLFLHCQFKNLASDRKFNKANRLKAAIEANNTALVVSYCGFEDIVHLGCIQTKKSLLLASYNRVVAKMVMKVIHAMDSVLIVHHNFITPKRYEHQTWPDGIYTNVGVGIIAYNEFDGLSDDAIDFDKSLAFIMHNNIKGMFDDGIDIDNGTQAYIVGNKINGIEEDGILVSVQSEAVLLNNDIVSSSNGLSLRNGGKVFAKNLNVSNSKRGILLFARAPLVLTAEDFGYVKEKIASLSKEDMDYWGFYDIRNSQEAIDLLVSSFERCGEYMVLKKIPADLKNLFKTLDIFNLKDVDDEIIYNTSKTASLINKEKRDNLLNYKNDLYIINSNINAEQDITTRSIYSLEIHNTSLNSHKVDFKTGGEIVKRNGDDIEGLFNVVDSKCGHVDKIIEKMIEVVKGF